MCICARVCTHVLLNLIKVCYFEYVTRCQYFPMLEKNDACMKKKEKELVNDKLQMNKVKEKREEIDR